MASSTINCRLSFSVGLMTLTLGWGMGLKELMKVSNWYGLLEVFTTALLQTVIASTDWIHSRAETAYCYHTTFVCTNIPTAREATPKHKKEETRFHKKIFTRLRAHKRHRGKSVWLHPKPLLSDTTLRMYDCDFHIMCVISQSGRFSNCPIMIYLPIQYYWRRDGRQT